MKRRTEEEKPPLREGEDYYFDELGRMVFTEKYHLKRGYCCGSGCRHCPYDGKGDEDKPKPSQE